MKSILILISLTFVLSNCSHLKMRQFNDASGYSGQAQSYSYYNPGDVMIGMSRSQVRGSWGEPSRIQVAGNTESGNERWIYSENVSNHLQGGMTRIIYFEQGQVVGWESTGSPYSQAAPYRRY